MPEEPRTVAGSDVMRRRLRAQPVLRLRELWDPASPESGAGQALARVLAEAMRQGLARAGTVWIVLGRKTDAGLIPGEAAVPVDRAGESVEGIEAVVVPGGLALSVLYRDDIHLTSGGAVADRLRAHAEAEGVALEGDPRWIYHTDPAWNLEPDDQLIEVLWPIRSEE